MDFDSNFNKLANWWQRSVWRNNFIKSLIICSFIPTDDSQMTPRWNPMIICYPPSYRHQGNLASSKAAPPEQFLRDRFLDRFLDDSWTTLSTNFHRHNHWPLPKTITIITFLSGIQASQDRQKIQPICPAPHLLITLTCLNLGVTVIGNEGNPSSHHCDISQPGTHCNWRGRIQRQPSKVWQAGLNEVEQLVSKSFTGLWSRLLNGTHNCARREPTSPGTSANVVRITRRST